MSHNSIISYEELLRFYESAGVDDALSETPINQFAQAMALQETTKPPFEVASHSAKTPSKPAQSTPSPASRYKSAVPNDEQVNVAKQLAQSANTLDELRDVLMNFDGCSLKNTAKNTCFCDGKAGSPLMLIGEMPGRDEDLEGIPFVGRTGQLLNKMLKAIGLERQEAYIANIIPWRPPGNRAPTPLEIDICQPFIDRQIELAAPKIIIAFGGPVAQLLSGQKQGILRLRGHWKNYITANGMTIPFMPTLHPAYLLHTPAQKKYAWSDLLEVKMKLKTIVH